MRERKLPLYGKALLEDRVLTNGITISIVDNRLSSALVFEADADWEVDFRRQLEDYALGSQYILNSIDGPRPNSPFGDDWDLLWLGHCSSRIDITDNLRFIIANDPTVTPPNHRTNYGGIPDMSSYDKTTRIIYATQGGTCMYAYALSYRGAQKILFHLSMSSYSKPIDYGISGMFGGKDRNFKCIGIFPHKVDSYRGPGSASRDSDIATFPDQVRKNGFSFNIVHSTRLNVGHLINEEKGQIQNQWAKETQPLIGPVRLGWEKVQHSIRGSNR